VITHNTSKGRSIALLSAGVSDYHSKAFEALFAHLPKPVNGRQPIITELINRFIYKPWRYNSKSSCL